MVDKYNIIATNVNSCIDEELDEDGLWVKVGDYEKMENKALLLEGAVRVLVEQRDSKASSFGPSVNGSALCESGSVASGGTKTHCSCDICF